MEAIPAFVGCPRQGCMRLARFPDMLEKRPSHCAVQVPEQLDAPRSTQTVKHRATSLPEELQDTLSSGDVESEGPALESHHVLLLHAVTEATLDLLLLAVVRCFHDRHLDQWCGVWKLRHCGENMKAQPPHLSGRGCILIN